MIGLLLKLLPTMWPFVKEIFAPNKRPRGGKQKTPVFRVIAICIIIIIVCGALSYDVIKTLYIDNQAFKMENVKLTQAAAGDNKRLLALETENDGLRRENLKLSRELSAANAKLDFLQPGTSGENVKNQ